jgi:hypothetical protein
LDMSELFVERQGEAVVIRDPQLATTNAGPEAGQWRLVPSAPKKVVYQGKEMYFSSAFERDVATLLVRAHELGTPLASRDQSPIPSQQDASAERVAALEKQLADAQVQLATAMVGSALRGVCGRGVRAGCAGGVRGDGGLQGAGGTHLGDQAGYHCVQLAGVPPGHRPLPLVGGAALEDDPDRV